MATASFRLTVDGKHEADVLHALAVELRSTRSRPGCTSCHIEKDANGHSALRFHSRWDNERHLRAFLASDVMTGVLQLLELSLEEPEILICLGNDGVGLRSLREIRGEADPGSVPRETRISGCGCEGQESTAGSFNRSGTEDLPGTRNLGLDSGEEIQR